MAKWFKLKIFTHFGKGKMRFLSKIACVSYLVIDDVFLEVGS